MDEVDNQINDLEHREATHNQSEQPVEKRIQKNEDSISSFWDNFKHSIIGVPGEEKEQEIRNLFEKIMKENFPNLVKAINVQVQEVQSPKQNGCKEAHSQTHHKYNTKG